MYFLSLNEDVEMERDQENQLKNISHAVGIR